MNLKQWYFPLILASLSIVPLEQASAAEDFKSDDPAFVETLVARPLTGLIELNKSTSAISVENTEFFAMEGYAPVMGYDCNHVRREFDGVFGIVPFAVGITSPATGGFIEIEDYLKKKNSLSSGGDTRLDIVWKVKVLITGATNYTARADKCKLLRVNGSRLKDGNWIAESTYLRLQDIRKIYRAASLQAAIETQPTALANIQAILDQKAAAIKSTADFRTKLQTGDQTSCGMVVEMKPPIALIQTPGKATWIRLDDLDTPDKRCRAY